MAEKKEGQGLHVHISVPFVQILQLGAEDCY